MQVLNLIHNFNYDLSFSLGEEIGFGADGQVFLLKDSPDKVIKLCVLYDWNEGSIDETYSNITKTLDFLKEHKPSVCSRVYEYGFLFQGNRYSYNGDNKYIVYYYIMEKLLKISEDERKAFHSLMSHEDLGIKKDYSIATARKMLVGMQRGLDFDLEKVLSFYTAVNSLSFKHEDIHVRNIMKSADGNFKLIDFDRSSLTSYSSVGNLLPII